MVGASLGAFLVQVFAAKKPHRVLSMLLINGFCDTTPFVKIKPSVGFGLMPGFYLKKIVLENFNQQAMDGVKVDAIDFIVEHFEQLTRPEIAGRLNMMCSAYELGLDNLPDGDGINHLVFTNAITM